MPIRPLLILHVVTNHGVHFRKREMRPPFILYLNSNQRWIVSFTLQLLWARKRISATSHTDGSVNPTAVKDAATRDGGDKNTCPFRESITDHQCLIKSLHGPHSPDSYFDNHVCTKQNNWNRWNYKYAVWKWNKNALSVSSESRLDLLLHNNFPQTWFLEMNKIRDLIKRLF